MFIDKASRAASLEHLTRPHEVLQRWHMSSDDVPCTELPTKPEQYAALALVIDQLIETSPINQSAHNDALITNPYTENRTLTGYQQLLEDASYALTSHKALSKISKSAIYQRTEQTTRLIGTHDPSRYDSLSWQLLGGVSTALTTSLVLLKELPQITEFHTGQTNVNYSTLARNSVGLPWTLAMMSIDQLLAFQKVVYSVPTDTFEHLTYSLNPEYFRVLLQAGEPYQVKFADIAKTNIPAGFSPHSNVPATETAMKLSALTNKHDREIIGCPVTLITKRLHQIWNWMIDAVDERQLWGSS